MSATSRDYLRNPPAAKLVCSIFSAEDELIGEASHSLSRQWGTYEWMSRPFSFDRTSYYEKEFGRDLKRRFFVFPQLVAQDYLVDAKFAAREVEERFARGGKRRVNIDPGILSLERLVLATGKNFTHRVYLARGVFADLVLIFQGGSFLPLPWTYPDYGSRKMIRLWNGLRSRYFEDLKLQK